MKKIAFLVRVFIIIVLYEYYLCDKVSAGDGSLLWQEGGNCIFNDVGGHHMLYPYMINGNSEVIFIYEIDENGRAESFDLDIYAQKINANGEILWQNNGIPICSEEGSQALHAVVSDGRGGAIIVWDDIGSSIYAQRIDMNGNKLWLPRGVQIYSSNLYRIRDVQVVLDGNEGAIITPLEKATDKVGGIPAQDNFDNNGTGWFVDDVRVVAE